MKILIVIDMQNDFINGSLGTKEALAILKRVRKKIGKYKNKKSLIFVTYDTHKKDYLKTLEGKKLPIIHCIKNTKGWELNPSIEESLKDCENVHRIEKETFGYSNWIEELKKFVALEDIEEIEICGLCTDICVVSNALILRALFKDIPIKVDSSCCAGVTPESHKAALETMEMCQIDII